MPVLLIIRVCRELPDIHVLHVFLELFDFFPGHGVEKLKLDVIPIVGYFLYQKSP